MIVLKVFIHGFYGKKILKMEDATHIYHGHPKVEQP
jgi:hypothetical protein